MTDLASTNWQEMILANLSFWITAIIVLSAAAVTYISNRKSVESQNALSRKAREAEHQNKISEFRHDWLQNLRNTSSELVKMLYECNINITLKDREFSWATQIANTPEGNKHLQNCERFESQFLSARAEFYRLHSKLKLFFKPNDPNAKELLDMLDDARANLYSDPLRVDDACIDKIVSEMQAILKDEWEVTKDRSWTKDA